MFIISRIGSLIESKQNSISGITIRIMAEEMGIPLSTLNNIKSGIAIPGVDKLEIMAKYFGVDMNYFFDFDTKKVEVESVKIKMTDGNEYLLKRFEELVAENTRLSDRVKELEGAKKYSLPDVQTTKVAESSVKLIK